MDTNEMKLQCPSCESFIEQVTPSRALCESCGGDWYVVTKWSSKCSAVMLVPRPPGAVRSEKEVEDRTNEQITAAVEKKLGKFGRVIVKETPIPAWMKDKYYLPGTEFYTDSHGNLFKTTPKPWDPPYLPPGNAGWPW